MDNYLDDESRPLDTRAKSDCARDEPCCQSPVRNTDPGHTIQLEGQTVLPERLVDATVSVATPIELRDADSLPVPELVVNPSIGVRPSIQPRKPLSDIQVLKLHRSQLNACERREISRQLNFANRDKFYFLGLDAEKSTFKDVSDYGDTIGRYRFIAHDHLSWRYEMLEVWPIGSGQLFRALDHRTGGYVFIKSLRMCQSPPYHALDRDMEVYDELKDMFDACAPDSLPIVQPIGAFRFRRHDFIVFPAFETTLSQHLVAVRDQPLEGDTIRQVARCLIDFLRILNKKQLVLGDLSADSIVIQDANVMRVQVIDCGRAIHPFVAKWRKDVSRRSGITAPEIACNQPFGPTADLYSLGKLLAAMSTNRETRHQGTNGEGQGFDGSLLRFIQGCTYLSTDKRWSLDRASNDSWLCKDGWAPLNADRPWPLTWIPDYVMSTARVSLSTLGSHASRAIGWTPANANTRDGAAQQHALARIPGHVLNTAWAGLLTLGSYFIWAIGCMPTNSNDSYAIRFDGKDADIVSNPLCESWSQRVDSNTGGTLSQKPITNVVHRQDETRSKESQNGAVPHANDNR